MAGRLSVTWKQGSSWMPGSAASSSSGSSSSLIPTGAALPAVQEVVDATGLGTEWCVRGAQGAGQHVVDWWCDSATVKDPLEVQGGDGIMVGRLRLCFGAFCSSRAENICLLRMSGMRGACSHLTKA